MLKQKIIQSNKLSSECWSVQFWGTKQCLTCEFYNTPECGGKNILKTGKNNLGITIGKDGI